LGYFSDSPTLIDFTYWCDEPLDPHLQRWQSLTTAAAAEHLADLVSTSPTSGNRTSLRSSR
jgi:hypothetical protein